AIASRLCECIAEQGQQVDGKILELTASIGGAHARAKHTEFNSVLMEADTALYTAKATGRNTVYFQPLPPEEATILNLSDRRRGQHVRQTDSTTPCS
ncbi:MAG: diguanylate cyclase, partial [Marinobacter sp.]|nr:diguanylate cyclase [Marinobacter sp.]